jgi:putative aminopeptidase FrvX
VIRGSVLPLMASGHAFNTAVDTMPISWDHVEVRLDAYSATRADCESVGINIGDFVAFDPLPEFTDSGHISARHLDDKAGVAALLAALKAIVDSGVEPLIDCHPLFTITEETGSGAAGSLPWDVSEFVGIDIAPVAPGQHSSEHAVSVATSVAPGRAKRSVRASRPVPLLLQRRALGDHCRLRHAHGPSGFRLRRDSWL